jgi:hypothetical protein
MPILKIWAIDSVIIPTDDFEPAPVLGEAGMRDFAAL